MTFFYLATPYSKYPYGTHDAFRLACECAAALIKSGIPVYSPIAHSHPIAKHGNINPLDHRIWLAADKPLMDAAKALIVLKAESWAESYGMAKEIQAFKAANKEIFYVNEIDLEDASVLEMLKRRVT